MVRGLLVVMVAVLSSCGPPRCSCAPPIGNEGETRFSGLPGQPGGGDVVVRLPGDPSARYLAAMAYDAGRDDFVMFGGQTDKGTSGETWLLKKRIEQYNVQTYRWMQVRPVHSPPPRRGAAIAYDPSHGVVLMYGGLIPDSAEGRVASDTWAWNGVDWTELASDSQPGPRDDAAMVSAGDEVLLFGGHVANVSYFGDAWSWDGSTWIRADRNPTPPGRGSAAAVWDQESSSLFVYGGYGLRPDAGPGNLGLPLADAWRLEGGRWTNLPDVPPALILPYGYLSKDKTAIVFRGVACPMELLGVVTWQLSAQKWVGPSDDGSLLWGAVHATDKDGVRVEFGGSNTPAC
jgi:hypothetical protein